MYVPCTMCEHVESLLASTAQDLRCPEAAAEAFKGCSSIYQA